ncbi:MAG TPA: hypothetical protein VFN48_06670 [Solirubrobacteraceae bacterium]|nr:hypothetical protein [Solirubrobacteraceae bacterium]
MEVIATLTFGLLVWVVLWALGLSGFDGILIAGVLFLIALTVQNVAPRIGSTKDQ